MSRVAIKEIVLRWAMERAGMTIDTLERKYPNINEWATGTSQPTLKQLEGFAKTTHTPLGFFFLPFPPDERLPIPHFRTSGNEIQERPTPALLETVHAMELRQAWMREFLIEQGQEPLRFVKSATPDAKPALVANRIRQALNLNEDWANKEKSWTDALSAMRKAMEAAGILVAVNGIVGNNTHWKLDPGEFRGFVLVDDYAPLVFVNGSDGKAAQMFTLAHELAHVFFGSSAAFDLREMQPADDPMEQACNRVAAELLLPEQTMRSAWPSAKNEQEPFQIIARQFKVSVIVAARRALDLGLIQKKDFFDFYQKYLADERRTVSRNREKEGGGDFYLNQNLRVGKRFASAVARATLEGKLLYSEAYNLTGLYGKTFDRYVDSLKIGGS
jgi:Zn-dependent peptidase ImmA (M78 family)